MLLAALPHGRVVVAVSGGPDSTALLIALQEAGRDIVAAHYDHALRDGSDGVALQVAELCARLGVPLISERRTEALPKGSLQAAARQLRYALLERARIAGHAPPIPRRGDRRLEIARHRDRPGWRCGGIWTSDAGHAAGAARTRGCGGPEADVCTRGGPRARPLSRSPGSDAAAHPTWSWRPGRRCSGRPAFPYRGGPHASRAFAARYRRACSPRDQELRGLRRPPGNPPPRRPSAAGGIPAGRPAHAAGRRPGHPEASGHLRRRAGAT